MRKALGLFSLVFFVAAMFSFTSLSSNDNLEDDKEPIIQNVSAEKFKSLIENKAGIILDVRTANEVAQGFIEGAINIDYYGKLFKNELQKLDKNTPVFVYCRSGGRSGKALQIMQDLGFVEVYNLIGGYSAWPYK